MPEERVSRREAADFQWKLIYEWTPQKDVWPFKHGLGILAASAGLSAMVISNHYRQKLRLWNYGRISMYIPIVGLPVFFLPLLHQRLVSEEILLHSSCPVCVQLRAIGVQSIVGVAYPLLISPIAAFMYSTSFATYKLPVGVSKANLIELYSIWKKITNTLTGKLSVVWALNIVLAVIITNYEAKSFFKIQNRIFNENKEKLFDVT